MLEINGTFFVTFAVVWLLVVVLTRVFFRPLQKIRAERQARLTDDREASRRAGEDEARGLRDVDAALRSARAAADKRRDDLEAEALREKSRLLADVSSSSKAEVEKAKAEMTRELSDLKAKLEAQAQTLAAAIEARLLQ